MIVVIDTPKPESLSIVAGECGVVRRSQTFHGPYEAVVALLAACSDDERRQLEMHDLRRIKQRAAGVSLPAAKPTDRETNAIGRL